MSRTYEGWYDFVAGWVRAHGAPPLVLTIGEWIDLRDLMVQANSNSCGWPIPKWPAPDSTFLGIPIRLQCPHDELAPPVDRPDSGWVES